MRLDQAYIGGASQKTQAVADHDIINPATGDVIGTMARSGAARLRLLGGNHGSRAQGGSRTGAGLLRGAHGRSRRRDDPRDERTGNDVRGLAGRGRTRDLKDFVAAIDKVHWVSTPDVGDCSDRIVMEHKGVAVLITPWNWPMNQITQKVGAALAAGCTMVLKPSELSSLSAQIFAKVMHDAKALPTLCRDRALAAARAMEAMGETRRDDPSWVDVLPIAIKDLHDVAGVRTTYGSPVYAHNLPDSSDDMVERLEAKGAIVIG